MQSLEPGADTWSVITYSAAGRAPSSNFWVGNSQFSCWQSLSPVYMYAHDTWKRRHTHTAAPCKLHFHQILLRCTFRCSGEGRGSWGNGWRLTEQVNEQEKSEKCVCGGGVDPGRSLRLTFPVCVRHESAHCSRLVVCLCHSSVYSFLTWWLGLLLPHLLQQLLPTQYFWMGTVFMCCVRAMAAGGGKWLLFIEPWKYHCFLHQPLAKM